MIDSASQKGQEKCTVLTEFLSQSFIFEEKIFADEKKSN